VTRSGASAPVLRPWFERPTAEVFVALSLMCCAALGLFFATGSWAPMWLSLP